MNIKTVISEKCHFLRLSISPKWASMEQNPSLICLVRLLSKSWKFKFILFIYLFHESKYQSSEGQNCHLHFYITQQMNKYKKKWSFKKCLIFMLDYAGIYLSTFINFSSTLLIKNFFKEVDDDSHASHSQFANSQGLIYKLALIITSSAGQHRVSCIGKNTISNNNWFL